MSGFNSYEDARRATAYSTLEFPGTYYLAYRDLPAIIAEHVRGVRAVDFGCGAGRSTRFLRRLGFEAEGVDSSAEMIRRAKEIDPAGNYRLIPDDGVLPLDGEAYDLVLSVFTFDNIPTAERKVSLFRSFSRLLRDQGRILSLVSSPDVYRHEWASFSTKDFPENTVAKTGDVVRCVIKGIGDDRPVEDVLWTDDSYREVYRDAGLELIRAYRPLGRVGEPTRWVSEARIPPWVIYVLRGA